MSPTRSRDAVTPNEQQVHGALVMLPFCALSFLVCLHWDQFRALWGADEKPASMPLMLKDPPLPHGYVVVMTATTGILAILYAEEFWRCVRAARGGRASIDRPVAAKELYGSSTDSNGKAPVVGKRSPRKRFTIIRCPAGVICDCARDETDLQKCLCIVTIPEHTRFRF
jgi:hypothetical protein